MSPTSMDDVVTRLVCTGCGAEAPAEDPLPFRCPNAGTGDVDHVLRRALSFDRPVVNAAWRKLFLDAEPNPFLRYRTLFHSYGIGTGRGLSDLDFVILVEFLDLAVVSVAGAGFRETPFRRHDALSGALGRAGGSLWIKDETGNVSGSHKARHLMGILVWLEMAHRAGLLEGKTGPGRLAIASCGNAALAAAVLARAVGRPLDVFIPSHAHPNVLRQLAELDAHLVVCPREGSAPGDPCMHRFHESILAGSLPFSVQGSENALTLEGGLTLGYEIVSALLREGAAIDRLFIQAGGGTLASSCIQALQEAKLLGLIERLPKIHAVQTVGAWPLRRAWDRVSRLVLEGEVPSDPSPRESPEDEARAASVASPAMDSKRRAALRYAATHRSQFMWPWESEPHSVAHGILDDETYDWLAVVSAMLETGGWPVVVPEDQLREANDLSRNATGIPADPTGTAGLAGCLRLVREGAIGADESVAVLLTGRTR